MWPVSRGLLTPDLRIDNRPICTNYRNFVCSQDKRDMTCEACGKWVDNQWQIFNKNEQKH